VQLRRLDELTERRRQNAAYLSATITSMATPIEAPGRGHVWHQYTIRAGEGNDRDQLVRRLAGAGIETAVFYPGGVHELDHVRAVAGERRLPVTEQAAREVLSLPVHPALSREDLTAVADAVNRFG
jgi:dTDP-4-amino-4,6-dideoxygalactose transaminase